MRVLRFGRVWAYQSFPFRVAVELRTPHNLRWVGTFGLVEHISNLALRGKSGVYTKNVYIGTCTCICLMHAHVYEWMYIYIYIYIYMYTYTHTYI